MPYTTKAYRFPKVLITVPLLSKKGGVSALYNLLQLNHNRGMDYFEVHGLFAAKKGLRLLDLFLLYIRFSWKINGYDILHTNPSLNSKSFYRDAFFILIAFFFSKKVLIYWHGWDELFEHNISKGWFARKVFSWSYARAHQHITVGSVFVNKLKRLGVKQEIMVESNAASDMFITESLPVKMLNPATVLNVLFIARVELEKGIYVAINAIRILTAMFPAKLIVAGSGDEMMKVKDYLKKEGIINVELRGFVEGKEKDILLRQADLLILPTYSEGMPLTLIEGMLYGIPLITRPVGGIPDWVKDGQNGILITSKDPNDFAAALLRLVSNKALYQSMSENNLVKARQYFTPKVVKQRLSGYYTRLIMEH